MNDKLEGSDSLDLNDPAIKARIASLLTSFDNATNTDGDVVSVRVYLQGEPATAVINGLTGLFQLLSDDTDNSSAPATTSQVAPAPDNENLSVAAEQPYVWSNNPDDTEYQPVAMRVRVYTLNSAGEIDYLGAVDFDSERYHRALQLSHVRYRDSTDKLVLVHPHLAQNSRAIPGDWTRL
jgi:hypothetical protein